MIVILVAATIAAYAAANSFYVVGEVEQVIVTQFGKPVGDPVITAGLKTKMPFVQAVNPIDKRIQTIRGIYSLSL
jgi:membrane protease subunit HflC